ncbi:MFS transporter [Pseudooceanicola sp. CBS1P-1]|uniref:MFS transporter n=1 Tax=Pseudooceanicola albus TaxID=2692189 RepID=A0A6L7G195_9RHOB|nr:MULTISPECIES: MFS transporter [Pseudooceanicola]MBT9383617.1 MFS transporter [Pseudooceanicola endophyticus]MXN17472.1 MFS transporter [Pseudooceanicola albus]
MTTLDHSPDQARSGWWPFAAAAFAFLVAMMGTTLPTPIYALYEQQFHLSQFMITVIYAVYAAGVIGALLLTGTWSDQIGRKPLLFAGLALSLVSGICFALSGGLWGILLARVLSGLSAGLFASTATAAVMDLVPEGQERAGILTATGVNMGGLGLGPLVAGAVVQYLPDPMLTPYLVHIALVILAGLAFLTVPETVARADHPDLAPQRPTLPSEVAGVFLPAALVAIAGFMVTGFYSAVVPSFLADPMGYHSHFLVGFVAGFLFLASTAGQILADTLPGRSHLKLGCVVLTLGVLVIAAGLWAETLWGLLPGTLIAGLGHGLAFRSGLGAVGSAAPEARRGSTIALYFTISYLAISVPVVLVGLAGLLWALKPVSIAFALLSALLSLLALWRIRGRD